MMKLRIEMHIDSNQLCVFSRNWTILPQEKALFKYSHSLFNVTSCYSQLKLNSDKP